MAHGFSVNSGLNKKKWFVFFNVSNTPILNTNNTRGKQRERPREEHRLVEAGTHLSLPEQRTRRLINNLPYSMRIWI